MDLDSSVPLPAQGTLDAFGFPYPLADNMRALGVQMDEWLTLDEHYKGVFARAQVRQGVLAEVAHSSWGLETSILRITHDALITSMLRYGLTLTGSCLPGDLISRVDTQVINTASRRITGLPLNARIEALRFIAGTHSMRNLYLVHCAFFLHGALASFDSGLQRLLQGDLSHFQGRYPGTICCPHGGGVACGLSS